MCTGKKHDLITIVLLPIIMLMAYELTYNFNIVIIFTVSYLFSSFMFNGDLDIISRPYQRWLFLKWIWYPYRKIIPHRSIWSHGIIIGTFIRLIYIMPILYIIFKVCDLQILNYNYVIIILLGLEMGNIIHTLSDRLSSY